MKKAIKIVRDRGVFSSIDWLLKQRKIGLSEKIKVLNDQTETSFEECQAYYSFEFNGNKYELFLENGHYFSTPDSMPYWGDARLVFNGELVFLTKYCEEDSYELITIDSTIKTLRLGDWVNDFPTLVKLEKNSLRAVKEKNHNENQVKQAKEIEGNFDLGQFEALNTIEEESSNIDVTLIANTSGLEEKLPDPTEIDLYDENGYTPLMMAVKEADTKLVITLIQRGANPKIVDEDFGTSTALNMAQLLFVRTGGKKYKKIIDLLKPIT